MLIKYIFICFGLCVLGRTINADVSDDGEASMWLLLFAKLNEISADNQAIKTNLLSQEEFENFKRETSVSYENLALEVKNLNQKVQEDFINFKQGILKDFQKLPYQEQTEYWNGSFWTVIQRRSSDEESFDRTWQEFKTGFGKTVHNFWLGLEALHKLTNAGSRCELLILMDNFENERRYALYDDFQIGSESEKYALNKLGEYSGTAGESLFHQLGQKFTTKDEDNDEKPDANCSVLHKGGWWHKECFHSHLNGVYRNQADVSSDMASGIHWLSFGSHGNSLKFVQMMVRMV